MSGEALGRAEERIRTLEAENKTLRAELETTREALDGAHRVVRQIRDQQSTFPGLEESHHGQVAG